MSQPASGFPDPQPELLRATTYWDLIHRRAQLTPQQVMWHDTGGRRMTFSQFENAAERLAAGLLKLGMEPGMSVAWQLPTRMSTAVLVAALSRLSVNQNPIIHLYREREVGAILRQSHADFLLTPERFGDRDYVAQSRAAMNGLAKPPQHLVFDGELPQGPPSSLPPPPASGDEVRWTLFTSGTTADPKGARHTDATLMAAGYGMAACMGLTGNDVGTVAYPYAHIGGPMYTVMVLATGMSAVLFETFSPAQALDVFRKLGVTQTGGSTAHYVAFLNEQRKQPGTPLSLSLRLLTGGGAPKPPELFHQVRQEMGCLVVHAYGMTESPLVAHGAVSDPPELLAHTEGRVIEGMEVRVVRLDGGIAAAGEEGEIRIRGTAVCKGYTDPALTQAAFDEQGYFRTGDLGVVNAKGYLAVTGRLKDVIIRKGENISAKELEDLLFQHPGIGAVAVIGLPDPERGERVCAVVETRAGAAPISFGGMVQFLESTGLMRQKIPEQLEIVDSLPRNETFNKVLKHKLRERFAAAPFPPR